MQELIQWMTENEFMVNRKFIDKVNECFKKEKGQMLDFGLYVKKNGWVGCKIEDLYEDYNNQNK